MQEHDDGGANGILRVGCIVENQPQCRWLLDLVQRSKSSGRYSIDLLIVQQPSPSAGSNGNRRATGSRILDGVSRPIAAGCFAVISWLESIVVQTMTGFTGLWRKYPLETIPVPRLEVRPVPEGDGRCHRYVPEDIARIRRFGLDVLVLVDRTRVLAGEVLEVCPYGTLSLERSGEHANLEGPPGFWEVVFRCPSTGFAIQRLGGGAAPGEMLFRGAINTAPLYALNAANVLRKSWFFLHRFLDRLARDRALPCGIEPAPDDRLLHGPPPLGAQARYLYRAFAHLSKRAAQRIAGIRWRWGVAYQFAECWWTADLSRSTIIPNPPRRFFADPCIVNWHGLNVCFVEDYDQRVGRARITAIRIDNDGHQELGVALEEPFHLSYPFVFEADGELYMCPESEQAREIRLYRCVEFPLKWQLHRVLMKEVAAVDTSIFFRQGRWWMLTNIDSAEIGDYRSELHAFHAETFDAQHWLPHAANPVVFDSERARNGGLIRTGDEIYRVFQVQGFDVYGESMGVARIDQLSEQDYAEQTVAAFRPTFLPGIAGVHSLSIEGRLLVLDFVKRQRI